MSDAISSKKCSYIANNGLRIVQRTYQSVSLTWVKEQLVKTVEEVVSTSLDSDAQDFEQSIQNKDGNWYEIQMKRGEHSSSWISIYKGYGDCCVANDLSPDSVVIFRMKRNNENEWGSDIVASTDPMPPSAEDLNQAVEMNSIYLVTRILGNTKQSYLKKLLTAHDRNGMTPLMVACHYGNVGIAERLISAGCDINELSSGTRRTPLMYACIMGRQSVVVVLDQRGVDWNIRDNCGCNAMDYTINGNHTALLRLAVSRLGGQSVHEKDSCGWTPLMRAVSNSLEIVNFLLRKGADINSVDRSNSKSVLMAAILSKKPMFVKFLLEKGANPFHENYNGNNCIQIARGLDYREIKEILSDFLNTQNIKETGNIIQP